MACDILRTNTTVTGTNHFTFNFHGCNPANTGYANVAYVRTDTDPTTGDIEHVFDMDGLDTSGSPFDETAMKMPAEEIEDLGEDPAGDAANINPTKVFLWIAKKVKEVVCPNCM